MPSILFYILKLSVALAAVHLFYQLVLRRLTFYNWNRWYLLVYTIFAFLIPFINITPILENNEWSDIRVINWVPALIENTSLQNIDHERAGLDLSALNIVMIVFISGSLFLFTRLIIQFISFNRMRKRATPFAENGLTIYQVNENIIPFSFGNSIFINKQLHSEEELREIIKHEFIHVKQKHSMDIIWGELLCLLNWYNPFAWLLKRSIRQNLEFIADNKVVQNGIDKKEYQYLLLKVIGNSQYSIATQFNFSSLKKRIAMMNKTKSARLQLGRFLFLVPVIAIILLAFRKSFNNSTNAKTNMPVVVLTDTIPDVKILNSKGYYIDIKDNKGDCMVVIKDKDKKEVKRLLLTEWNEKQEYYENMYGGILSSPVHFVTEINPGLKEFLERNQDVKDVGWVYNNPKENIRVRMHVMKKDGSEETYNLENKDEVDRVERKYGKLPAVPTLLQCNVKEVEVTEKSLSELEEVAELKEVMVAEVPVKVVTADLAEVTVIGTSSKKAISTTGEIKEVTVVEKPLTKTIVTNSGEQEVVVTGVLSKKVVPTTGEIKEVTVVGKPLTKTIVINPDINEVTVVGKPSKVSTTAKRNVVSEAVVGTTITSTDQAMIGDENIKIMIKNTDKPEDLESFISMLKDKGYELKFDNKDYNNGILKNLSGTIKYKGSSSTFSFTDFDEATIIVYRDGDKINFKIYSGKKKVAL